MLALLRHLLDHWRKTGPIGVVRDVHLLHLLASAFLSTVFAFCALAPLRYAELALADWRTTFLGRYAGDKTPVTVIALDEASLQQAGEHFPVDRLYLARLLRAVVSGHPRVIGLSFRLDQATASEADAALVKALVEAPMPVIWEAPDPSALSWQTQFSGDLVKKVNSEKATATPKAEAGAACLRHDGDGTVRAFVLSDSRSQCFAARLADSMGASLPDDAEPRIAWRGDHPDRDFNTLNASELLDASGEPRKVLLEGLKGRAVLIGIHLPKGYGRVRVPFVSGTEGDDHQMSEVMVQATIVDQVVSGRHILGDGWILRCVMTLALAVLGALLADSSPGRSGRLVVAAGLAYAMVNGVVYAVSSGFGLIVELPILTPLVALAAGFVVIRIWPVKFH